jgi:hypothetical protein
MAQYISGQEQNWIHGMTAGDLHAYAIRDCKARNPNAVIHNAGSHVEIGDCVRLRKRQV